MAASVRCAVGEVDVGTLTELESRLQLVLKDESSPFEQVIVQVGPDLRDEELMKVIDRCTNQTLKDGSKLRKLSFVEREARSSQSQSDLNLPLVNCAAPALVQAFAVRSIAVPLRRLIL